MLGTELDAIASSGGVIDGQQLGDAVGSVQQHPAAGRLTASGAGARRHAVTVPPDRLLVADQDPIQATPDRIIDPH
jgi:hypothetical protein